MVCTTTVRRPGLLGSRGGEAGLGIGVTELETFQRKQSSKGITGPKSFEDNDWRDADKKIALSPDQRDRVLQALESETRYGNTGWASDSNCGSLSLVWGVKCTDFSI